MELTTGSIPGLEDGLSLTGVGFIDWEVVEGKGEWGLEMTCGEAKTNA